MYGEKIKAKRRELNLSQEDLADKLGVTRQTISKWENDKATPTMTNLKELSEIFEIDITYFIGNLKLKNEVEGKNKDGKLNLIGEIFVYIVLSILGFLFFAVYYFLFMEEFLKANPKEIPFLYFTVYMIVAVFSFPQGYKDLEKKFENLDYNLFSKVILPLIYIFSPIIVLYFILKNKD